MRSVDILKYLHKTVALGTVFAHTHTHTHTNSHLNLFQKKFALKLSRVHNKLGIISNLALFLIPNSSIKNSPHGVFIYAGGL